MVVKQMNRKGMNREFKNMMTIMRDFEDLSDSRAEKLILEAQKWENENPGYLQDLVSGW